MRRYRPDIFYLEGITFERLTSGNSLDDLKTAATLHIIEVGYSADTRVQQKRAEKIRQHELLVADLTRSGWNCLVHVIVLGVGGSIFRESNQALVELGVSTYELKKLNKALVLNGVIYLQKCYNGRKESEFG